MRFKSIVLCIIFLFLFASCGVNETIDEADIPVISEKDYFSADIIEKTEDMISFKKTVSFSQAYPNVDMIDLTNIKKPREDAALIFVDNQGNIYFQAENGEDDTSGALFSYNYSNDSWTTLIETDEDHNCCVICANERYMLWMKDENANWLKTSLHLLDLNTKESVKIYDFSLDPETNLMYAWKFSTPVIIDDNVYFEDIVGVDKNGLYDIRMYSYSITDKKVTLLDKDAKWPMEFKGEAAWLRMSSDEKNSLFYSAKQEKLLFKTETRLGTVFTADGDIIVANDYLPQGVYDQLYSKSDLQTEYVDDTNDPRTACYGIKVYKNNKIAPVFVAINGNVTNAVTNGDLVGWLGSSVGKPLMYSLVKDVLIEFDQLEFKNILSYNFRLSDNYAIITCGSGDNENYTYMWKIN